jgi:hypothetical protein
LGYRKINGQETKTNFIKLISEDQAFVALRPFLSLKVASGLAEDSCWDLATVAMEQISIGSRSRSFVFMAIGQFFSGV